MKVLIRFPSNYSDFLAAGSTLKKSNTYLGISEVNAIWWQRFFNFLPLYYAASGGAPIVKDGKAAFNNEYGIMVFDFLQKYISLNIFQKNH
jgi:multiple sugar transport system substrate-binding protein